MGRGAGESKEVRTWVMGNAFFSYTALVRAGGLCGPGPCLAKGRSPFLPGDLVLTPDFIQAAWEVQVVLIFGSSHRWRKGSGRFGPQESRGYLETKAQAEG